MGRLPVAGPVIIPSCLEVVLTWTHAGGQWHNVLHGHLTAAGPINPSLAETLFTGFKGSTSTTAWLALLASSIGFAGVSVKDLRQGNNPEYLSTSGTALGTGAGPCLPLNCSLVTTLRTGGSGQGFRGRVYLAGILTTSMISPTHFDGPTGSAAVAFINGLNSVMATNSVPMVVAQRALQAGTHHDGSPWAARPADVVPVTSVDIANPRVDSQRKRAGR